MEELTELERLELAYKYSTSKRHKIVKDKIKKIKNKKSDEQQSFL